MERATNKNCVAFFWFTFFVIFTAVKKSRIRVSFLDLETLKRGIVVIL